MHNPSEERSGKLYIPFILVAAMLFGVFVAQSTSALTTPPRFDVKDLHVVQDSYISQQGKETAALIVNYLAAYLPKGREQEGDLRKLTALVGVQLVAFYDNRFAVFRLPDDIKNREALVQFAMKVREAAAPSGINIGLAYASPQDGAPPYMSRDELIVGATKGGDAEGLRGPLSELGLTLVARNPYVKEQAVFRVRDPKRLDLIALSREVMEKSSAAYAYPNFTGVSFDTETVLNDPLFNSQWHHRNTGQAMGTVGADARLSLAWDITQGAAGTVIAIHENGGFDLTHPDLTPNLWTNPGETPGDGVDNDGNGWVDDTLGWNFEGCTMATSPGCGTNSPAPAGAATENHGTAVAGVAAARGGNMVGVSGSCPQCRLMLLRSGYVASDFAKSLPFSYAQAHGAQVISNSWTSGNVYPNTTAAINAATAAGVTVVFASGNTDGNNCGDPRVGNNASVLAVSSSTNQDRRVIFSSIGNCVDILAPSHRGYLATDPFTGTLNITTTDRQATGGYNNTAPVTNCPSVEAAAPPADARDYTSCFGGTSSAAPLTAGVVGLIRTANPAITRVQIQNLLQDTADRIEDSVGAYAESNGFSAPAGGTPTHSNGRLNAFEALRVAAPVTMGGRGGVDVFIRDNRLDWGNTQQPSNTLFEATRGFIPHWRSVDIKVDAPPYAPTPPTTNAQFEAFLDEDPIESTTNRVYVRVRNRGPVTAASVTVKMYWAFAGTALPGLPGDFWTAFPANSADTTVWHPEPAQVITNLAYSGASVAGTGGDNAQILTFNFNAPAIDPTAANPRHYCLMVVLDSPQDPVNETSLVVDNATPNNNNITHRNVSLQDSDADQVADSLFVRNPYRKSIRAMVLAEVPEKWKVDVSGVPLGQPFSLDAGSQKLLKYVIYPPGHGARGDVSFVQYDLTSKEPRVMGGFSIAFASRKQGGYDPKLAERLEKLERLEKRLTKSLDRLDVLLPRLEKLTK